MTSLPNQHSRRFLAAIALIVIAPWLWIFAPVLFKGDVFAFRDVANFYYPSFEWQCSEWGERRIPFWNPYDNLGTPTLADATSSIFYPGKLLFALPLDFVTRFNLYITLHILLAAATAYWLARRWQCSVEAAAICAISYAYGGYTLFQYSNVVFLVGAAWLPAAVGLVNLLLVERRWPTAVALGSVLAMIVLGGDPQTAYHVGILAALHAIQLWRSDRQQRATHAAPPSPAPSEVIFSSSGRPLLLIAAPVQNALVALGNFFLRSRLMLLVGAGAIGFSLAAVQVLPSLGWAGRSQRACYDAPRNIYQAAAAFFEDSDNESFSPTSAVIDGLFRSPSDDSHAAHTYYYSVGPWRWLEVIWPNVSGRMFPTHRRWVSAIPAEGRVWTASLYCGLVPLIGALGVGSWRRANPQERWAMIMLLVGMVASCGWYGIGWVLHEVQAAILGDGKTSWLHQPVGGLYWLFVVCLPGYDFFRYPAKWFVVASLGLALLGARGIDRLWENEQRFERIAKWLGIISGVAVIAMLAVRSFFIQRLTGVSADSLFGPLDARGSWLDIVQGLSHTGLVAALFVCVLRNASLRSLTRPTLWFLLITAVDLTVANHWLIATVPGMAMRAPANRFGNSGPLKLQIWATPPSRAMHSNADSWLPRQWREARSENRFVEIVEWERRALLHKYHLQSKIAMLDTSSTLAAAEFQALMRLIRSQPGERTNPQLGVSLLPSAVGVSSVLRLSGDEIIADPPLASPRQPNIRSILNSASWERVWLVHNVYRTHLIEGYVIDGAEKESTHSLAQIENRLRQYWFDSNAKVLRAVDNTAFVDAEESELNETSPPIRINRESAIIRNYEPQLVTIDVALNSPGLLVLTDLYDDGWRVLRQTSGLVPTSVGKTLRVNGILRGVWLPAGIHQVVFEYRPVAFYVGAWWSVIALGFVITSVFIGRCWRAGGRQPNGA